jgi:hypothetical protein
MSRHYFVLNFIVLSILLSGCSTTYVTQSTTSHLPTTTETHEVSALINTSWILYSMGDAAKLTRVRDSMHVNLYFTEHGYGCHSSECGGFGGTYSTNGEKIMLGEATYAWEIPDDDIVLRERYLTFLYVIHNAKTYKITKNRMYLYSDNGTYLKFE